MIGKLFCFHDSQANAKAGSEGFIGCSESAVNENNLKPWPKGQSGNPTGRSKGIAALARQHTDKALTVLVNALDDSDARVRVAASKEILDRGFGKSIAMTADLTDKLDQFDDDVLDAAIDVLRAAISSTETVDGSKGGKTAH